MIRVVEVVLVVEVFTTMIFRFEGQNVPTPHNNFTLRMDRPQAAVKNIFKDFIKIMMTGKK